MQEAMTWHQQRIKWTENVCMYRRDAYTSDVDAEKIAITPQPQAA